MCIKWKRRGKMKKQVKKFMSALLACVMVAVSVIVFDMNPVHAASGAITEASGWLETAYVKWTPVTGATGYNVYVKSASASDSAYVQLDDELIRKYPSYMRADAVGLKAGDCSAEQWQGEYISCYRFR